MSISLAIHMQVVNLREEIDGKCEDVEVATEDSSVPKKVR